MAKSVADKQKFIDVLRAKNFHIGKACEAFGVSRQTFYDWMKEEDFAQKVNDLEQREIDDSEEMHRWLRTGIPDVQMKDGKQTVVGWIKEPDRQALEKFLTTKGRGRGWGDQLNIQGSGANGEIIIVRIPDNGRDKT